MSPKVEAVVARGWETPEFYANWIKGDDSEIVSELVGTILNPGSPRSELAPAILEVVRDIAAKRHSFS